MPKNIFSYLLILAFIMLIAGGILQYTGHDFGTILFLGGAILYLIVRIIMHRRGKVKDK